MISPSVPKNHLMYTMFGKHCCTWDTFITFSCRSQLCTFSHTCLKFHHLPQCPLEIQGTVTAPSSGSLGTRLFCVLGSHSTLLFNDSYTSLKFIYLFIWSPVIIAERKVFESVFLIPWYWASHLLWSDSMNSMSD